MARYVALLRAINVGKRTVKMDNLRSIFEANGHANVSTFIASGNVLFDADTDDVRALEERVEAELEEALGFEVGTFIRTPAQLAALASLDPFAGSHPSEESANLYVTFLKGAPDAAGIDALMAYRSDLDDFHVGGGEIWWRRLGTMADSKFSGGALEKSIRGRGTMRNITTVRKLAALCEKEPPPPAPRKRAGWRRSG
jgi:uncharacterized protein (DUF1697 family)